MNSREAMLKMLEQTLGSAQAEIEKSRRLKGSRLGQEVDQQAAEKDWLESDFPAWREREWDRALDQADSCQQSGAAPAQPAAPPPEAPSPRQSAP